MLIPAPLFRSEKHEHVCGAGMTTAMGGGRVAGARTPQRYVPNDPKSHPSLNVDTQLPASGQRTLEAFAEGSGLQDSESSR
jgi:hypothetical protein